MIIFAFKNYREAFAELFLRKRSHQTGWSTAQLAQSVHLQPSHITNVIKGRSHFSSDQIYAICEQLDIDQASTEYLNALMELERAQHSTRKRQLSEKCERLRNHNLRVEKVLKSKEPRLDALQQQKYYLDPNIELLHLYLGTTSAPTDFAKLAELWKLPVSYVAEIVEFLQETGLVKKTARGWKMEPIFQHLGRDSVLTKPQQMLKRLRAMQRLQQMEASKTYSYSGTLTMTEETKHHIQTLFIEFLQKCEAFVMASRSEQIYHLQFDLFSWL